MRMRRVAVIGGGPGGLYTARLLKLADPGLDVHVYEQGTPDHTFGFGVGLAAGTQRNLRAADPDSLSDILDQGLPHDMSMRVGDTTVVLPNHDLRAIGRTTLLGVLQRHARAAGVDLHFGTRVVAGDVDADLVVAADGVSSATRERHATEFGAQVEVGDGLYLWCGTDFALPRALFMPITTDAGTFTTHAYPYAPDRSTFLVETDESTWRGAGFDATTDTVARGAADDSDVQSLQMLSELFAEPLEGHPLIGNRTRWQQFRTVRCETWHHGNVVLLGDAAHTAHYSIGSGTKLAMEDAIALVGALDEAASVDDALSRYEHERRPAVEHLQSVAVRSQRWWDTFPTRLDLPVHRLLVSYMTRAGKVSLASLASSSPAVVGGAVADYVGTAVELPADKDALVELVLGRPLQVAGRTVADRRDRRPADAPDRVVDVEFDADDAWGPKADTAIAAAHDATAGGASTVRLTGPSDRDDVLNRLDLAERLRNEVAPVTVRAPRELLPDLAAAVLAGRTDLVEMV